MNRRSLLSITYLVLFFTGAVFGYIWIEGYSLLEALYMVVITVTTVGYGEVRHLSDAGRLFTTLLIVMSFISFGIVGKIVAETLVENIWSGASKDRKMHHKIARLKDHYIICGFGKVGRAVAEDLMQAGLDLVVITQSTEHFEHPPFDRCLYLIGDAAQEQVLMEAGVKHARGVITLINSDPTNLYVVLTSRELNPMLHIVSRADELSSIKRIKQGGADHVISTYISAGKRIAEVVLLQSGEAKEMSDRRQVFKPAWVEVQVGSGMIGKSLGQIGEEMGREVLGLRRGTQDHIQPSGEVKLEVGDQFLAMVETDRGGLAASPIQPSENRRKVVMVDDNEVILRLYTRLFQKAGFLPMTALDGRAGLELIIQEQPEIAVIDFQLPKLSGLEVCRLLRQQPGLKDLKILLFTSDESAKIHGEAKLAGADEVIHKTPDAFSIIKRVLDIQSPAT
ncbi:MAG: NAD-binding protein [bacterium]|nr:NAD-binding protein [bacterium]